MFSTPDPDPCSLQLNGPLSSCLTPSAGLRLSVNLEMISVNGHLHKTQVSLKGLPERMLSKPSSGPSPGPSALELPALSSDPGLFQTNISV